MAPPTLRPFLRRSRDDGEHWVTVSDMMAGLMMVFLLISVTLMAGVTTEREREQRVCRAIRGELETVFENSKLGERGVGMLWRQRASGDDACLNICYTFSSDAMSFEQGDPRLPPTAQENLRDFLPDYLSALHGRDSVISEVRIGGHTSSEWSGAAEEQSSDSVPYFNNMKLSQDRARNVLEFISEFVRDNRDSAFDENWVHRKFVAVGYSSSWRLRKHESDDDGGHTSRLLMRKDTPAHEDKDASRRFEFCVAVGDDPRNEAEGQE